MSRCICGACSIIYTCKNCGHIWDFGASCPVCGYLITKSLNGPPDEKANNRTSGEIHNSTMETI